MLEGTLEDFPLHDVLQLLALTGRTGRLRLTVDGLVGHVDLVDGEVTSAVSPTTPDSPPVGAGTDDADGAARTRVGDVAVELMRWRRGTFAFESGVGSPDRASVHPSISVEELLVRELEQRLLDGVSDEAAEPASSASGTAPSSAPSVSPTAFPPTAIDEDVLQRLIEGVRKL